jgi:hypothetical protein
MTNNLAALMKRHIEANAELCKMEKEDDATGLDAACDVEASARLALVIKVKDLNDAEFLRLMRYVFEVEYRFGVKPNCQEQYAATLIALANRFGMDWDN